jgi:hypothetical protein
MYRVHEVAGPSFAEYTTSGDTAALASNSEQCQKDGTCSKVQEVWCTPQGTTCSGGVWMQASTGQPHISVAMKPSHAPDWCAS